MIERPSTSSLLKSFGRALKVPDPENSHISDATPETLKFSNLAVDFARAINAGATDEDIRQVLAIAEHGLQDGSTDLKDAVATGFLERLMAEASAGRLDFRRIAPNLGHRSRQYCREWDDFTGVQTPGL